MKEVGLSVPNTWDELIADVPKFKAAGYIPLAWGNLTRNTCPDFFLPLVAQYGGDVYALDDHTAPGLSWDSKPVIDALGLLQRLAKSGVFPPGINGIDDPQSYQLAYQGRAAMFYGGSWTPGIFAHDGSKDWLDNYSVHKVPAVTRRRRPLHRRRRRRGLVGQRQEPEQGPRGQVHRLHLPPRCLQLARQGPAVVPVAQERRRSDRQSEGSHDDPVDRDRRRRSHPVRARQLGFGLQRLPERARRLDLAGRRGQEDRGGRDGRARQVTDRRTLASPLRLRRRPPCGGAAKLEEPQMATAVRPMHLSLRLRRLIAPALFIAPAALALILTMAAPMADAVLLSLQHWNGMTPPTWAGFSNYLNLIHDETFFRALWHTAYFTVCTVILQTILPLLIASLLNSGIRGSTVFRTLYFMPVIISLAISGLLWAMLFEPNFGAVNSFLRAIGLGAFTQLWLADANTVMPSVIIVSVWQSLGFYLVIFFAALQSVPKDLYEAAELDGANAWTRFLHVTVPTIRPVILIVIVLNTINGIKVFDQIWVMTAGGPNYASATLGTYLYTIAFGAMGASNSRLGYATAIAIVILLLSIVVSIIQIRLGRRRDLDSQIEM